MIPMSTDNEIGMNAMPVRKRQSPDNNSLNETTSSAGTSDTSGSTSSLPSADSMDSLSDERSTFNSTANGSAQVNSLQPCSIWHISLTWVSIGLCVYDVYSDYARAVNYGLDQHYLYCALTLASALTPLWIITTIIRHRDDNNTSDHFPVWSSGHNTLSPDNGEPSTGFDPLPPPVWYRYTRTLLMWAKLAHIQRYIDILLHGLNSRQRSRSRESRQMNLNAVRHKSTEMTTLMLMVCFMGSAPQLVLQLYIEAKDMPQTISLWTEVCILGSLVALSKSMLSSEFIQMPNMHLQNCYLTSVWYGQCPDDRWYKTVAVLPTISSIYIGLNAISSIMDIWKRSTGPPATSSPMATQAKCHNKRMIN
ncbi:unnamed protein product [Medioppia subpectinata]|uniref:XK-related protein n=1 Tax=Medioppia subpectinata TaxID=1979941 RepID=A0A7R9KQ05_9ACAR|nr:unnamed protein product [Medioppia subpectinata]CAG2107681.1 unnamed protein product [Medioppia subpectinata]